MLLTHALLAATATYCLQSICEGVSQVLAKSPEQLAEMGRKARSLFELDRAAFVDNMRDVLGDLQDLVQVAAAAARMEQSERRP